MGPRVTLACDRLTHDGVPGVGDGGGPVRLACGIDLAALWRDCVPLQQGGQNYEANSIRNSSIFSCGTDACRPRGGSEQGHLQAGSRAIGSREVASRCREGVEDLEEDGRSLQRQEGGLHEEARVVFLAGWYHGPLRFHQVYARGAGLPRFAPYLSCRALHLSGAPGTPRSARPIVRRDAGRSALQPGGGAWGSHSTQAPPKGGTQR